MSKKTLFEFYEYVERAKCCWQIDCVGGRGKVLSRFKVRLGENENYICTGRGTNFDEVLAEALRLHQDALEKK